MPRQVDVEQKRTEVAYATWSVIARQGLQAATLRAVAAEAGVSLGAVQHYFASKDALLLFACQHMADLAGQQWDDLSRTATAREKLDAMAATSLTDHPLQRVGIAAWSAFVGGAGADPGIATIVRDAWSSGLRATAALIAEARGDHLMVDAELQAETYLALIDGLSVRVLAGHLSFDQARRLAADHLDRLERTS